MLCLDQTMIRSLGNHHHDGNKNITDLHNYLTMTNNSFAHFAPAWYIFGHSCSFHDVKQPVLQLWAYDDKMFNFVLLSLKSWFQLNYRIVRVHFASMMTLNHYERIVEMQIYIFQMTFSLLSNLCLLKVYMTRNFLLTY